METTSTDYLFAVKAAVKEINARANAFEQAAKSQMLEEYKTTGNDRKRSPMFGKEAGYLGIQEGKTSEHVTRFQLVDPDAFVDWMDEAKPETDTFAMANMADFAEFWFHQTGECPDGCTVVEYESEPGEPIAKLVVKEKVVIEKMREREGMADDVTNYLLGTGETTLMLGDGNGIGQGR